MDIVEYIKKHEVDPLSFVPLHLESFANGNKLADGTGFVILYENVSYLVTNRHVLSGRNILNKPISATAAIPDTIQVWFHSKSPTPFSWLGVKEPLIDESSGENLWAEHPEKHKVDVAALPLNKYLQGVRLVPLDLSLSESILIVSPSEPVSIVGFPLGLKSFGRFPIWKTGHIASDIELDYHHDVLGRIPAFLIDATTKEGMSGSPVLAKRVGWHKVSNDSFSSGEVVKFLGIYSGRIHEQSDVGIVWKPSVISEVLRAAHSKIHTNQ